MYERRFTNHAVWPKTNAIYTTSWGILRPSPNNRTAKVRFFLDMPPNILATHNLFYANLTNNNTKKGLLRLKLELVKDYSSSAVAQ